MESKNAKRSGNQFMVVTRQAYSESKCVHGLITVGVHYRSGRITLTHIRPPLYIT